GDPEDVFEQGDLAENLAGTSEPDLGRPADEVVGHDHSLPGPDEVAAVADLAGANELRIAGKALRRESKAGRLELFRRNAGKQQRRAGGGARLRDLLLRGVAEPGGRGGRAGRGDRRSVAQVQGAAPSAWRASSATRVGRVYHSQAGLASRKCATWRSVRR